MGRDCAGLSVGVNRRRRTLLCNKFLCRLVSYTVVRIVLSIYTPLSLVEINRKSSRVSLSPQGNRVVRGKKSVNNVTLICSTEGEMQVLLQLRDLVSRRHVIEDKTKAKSSSRCCGWNRGNMDKRLYCGTASACTCTSQQHDVTQFQIATMIKTSHWGTL